ncbi:MAG: DUF503 domain-containing protein [Thermomicrobiales bacterium]
MSTAIGVAEITLHLKGTMSLKDKRRVVKSLIQRLRNTFNISVAEISDLDDIRLATIAIVCVSNNHAHAQEMLAKAISFVDRNVEMGVLGEVATEIIH